jgi:hypothetical protein
VAFEQGEGGVRGHGGWVFELEKVREGRGKDGCSRAEVYMCICMRGVERGCSKYYAQTQNAFRIPLQLRSILRPRVVPLYVQLDARPKVM